MPLEKAIVGRLQAKLNLAGKVIKTEGGGEPDLIGVWRGVPYAIEVKQPGKKPTPLQLHRLEQWRRAGAIAMWITNADEAFDELDNLIAARLGK